MQRTLLIALATAVVAAGIATTATILLTDDEDNAALVSPSPSFTPIASAAVESASPSASPAASAGASPGSTASPDETDAPATTKPGVKIRSASSVECESESAFCSSTDEMLVLSDRELDGLSEASDPKSDSRPTVTMNSEARDADKDEIENGGTVSSLHVSVVVSNASESTFVFAKREIVLEIFRNGKPYDSFSTNGSGFEMTPGSKMTGSFDRPITESGTYEWRAKVWYYKK